MTANKPLVRRRQWKRFKINGSAIVMLNKPSLIRLGGPRLIELGYDKKYIGERRKG